MARAATQPSATALHHAALIGHLEAVQLLLEHGADKELEMYCAPNHGGQPAKPREVVCFAFNDRQWLARSDYPENYKNKDAIKTLLR